jgi:hypothetical protein
LKSILGDEKGKRSIAPFMSPNKYFIEKHLGLIIDPISDEFETTRREKITWKVEFPRENYFALEIRGRWNENLFPCCPVIRRAIPFSREINYRPGCRRIIENFRPGFLPIF